MIRERHMYYFFFNRFILYIIDIIIAVPQYRSGEPVCGGGSDGDLVISFLIRMLL